MRAFKSIYEWWKGKRRIDAVPFEELQSSYRDDPAGCFKEFVRRLSGLVFSAAASYLKRIDPRTSTGSIRAKTERIFQEFSPQFIGGEPQTILLRFADVIRRELDDATFSAMAPIYYLQLPIYHVADDRSRQLLAAFLQEGKPDEVVELLAQRFNEPVEQIEYDLQKANRDLRKVISEDFTPEELRELTEGYISKESEIL